MPTDGTVSYKTNEGVYDIPVEKQQDFLKQNPHAEEVKSFIQGKDTFDIPINKVNDFTKQYPDAQPLKKKESAVPVAGSLIAPSGFGGLLESRQKSESGQPKKPDRSIYGNLIAESDIPVKDYYLTKPDKKVTVEQQDNFNKTLKSTYYNMLLNPKGLDKQTRDDYYDLYGKDYTPDQLKTVKEVGERGAQIQEGYSYWRDKAHANPTDLDALGSMGIYQAMAGDYTLAHKTFTYLMTEHPKSPNGYAGNAYIAGTVNNDPDKALEFIKEGLKNNPDNAGLFTEGAKYASYKKDWGQASIYADQAIKKAQPGSSELAQAYTVRAKIKEMLGDHAQSVADTNVANTITASIDKINQDKETANKQKPQIDNAKEEAVKKQGVYNIGGAIKYTNPFTHKEEDIQPQEAEKIAEGIISGKVQEQDKEAQEHPDLISMVGGTVGKYVGQAVQGAVEGAKQVRHGINNIANGEVVKGALQTAVGGATVGFSAAAFTPVGVAFNEGTKALSKVAPTLTDYLTQPFTKTFDPTSEDGKLAAQLGDVLSSLLIMHRAGEAGKAIVEGYKGEATEQKIQPDNTPINQTSVQVPKEVYIENTLNDFKNSDQYKKAQVLGKGYTEPMEQAARDNAAKSWDKQNGKISQPTQEDINTAILNHKVTPDGVVDNIGTGELATAGNVVKSTPVEDVKKAADEAQKKALTKQQTAYLKKSGFSPELIAKAEEQAQKQNPDIEKQKIDLESKVERAKGRTPTTESAKTKQKADVDKFQKELDDFTEKNIVNKPIEKSVDISNPEIAARDKELQEKIFGKTLSLEEYHQQADEAVNKAQTKYDAAQKERFDYIEKNVYPQMGADEFDKIVDRKSKAEKELNEAKRIKEALKPLPEPAPDVSPRTATGKVDIKSENKARQEAKKKVLTPKQLLIKKIFSEPPSNIEESVLRYFFSGGNVDIEHFKRNTGYKYNDYKPLAREGLIKKNGQRSDVPNEYLEGQYEKFGNDEDASIFGLDQQDAERALYDIMTEHPKGNLSVKESMFQRLKELHEKKDQTQKLPDDLLEAYDANNEMTDEDIAKMSDEPPPQVVDRNPALTDYIPSSKEGDVKFGHDIEEKYKGILSALGTPHYLADGSDEVKNFSAKKTNRAGILRETNVTPDYEKLVFGDDAHTQGAPVVNKGKEFGGNETVQGDGRTEILRNLTDDQKNEYYDYLRANKAKLGFTDDQINEAQQKGLVYQRMIDVDDQRMNQLSLTDARNMFQPDEADKIGSNPNMQPAVGQISHLFDGRPLDEILKNDGMQVLDALNKNGLIDDLTFNKMHLGRDQSAVLHPDYYDHLKDILRTPITGGINGDIPMRDYYDKLPDISKNSLDAIIPAIMGLPEEHRPTEYIQRALAVLGNKAEGVDLQTHMQGIKNLTDIDKAFIPFIADPVSTRTLPDFMRDYTQTLNPIDYEGKKPITKAQAMAHLFQENEEHDILNNQEHEINQNFAPTSAVGTNQPSPQGETDGQNTGQETFDKRTDGQKVADQILGAIPLPEDVSKLPDDLNITENNVLSTIIPLGRAGLNWYRKNLLPDHLEAAHDINNANRKLFKLDNRDAAHAISDLKRVYGGDSQKTDIAAVKLIKLMQQYYPDNFKQENSGKVYGHFDRMYQAFEKNEPFTEQFTGDNEGQQILYQITKSIFDRITAQAKDLENVKGLPEPFLKKIKQGQSGGFLHRIVPNHYDEFKQAVSREAQLKELQAYKEGRKSLKDIGGVRGLFQQTMAEEQVKKHFEGYLGNSDYNLMESRKTLEAVDKHTGEKKIVEFQDNGKVVEWQDGKSKDIGNYNETQGNGSLEAIRKANHFTDEKGNKYSLNSGTVADLNKATGRGYLEQPLISALETLKRLNQTRSIVTFFHSVRNSPEVAKFMKVMTPQQIQAIENIGRASTKNEAGLVKEIVDYNKTATNKISFTPEDTPNDLTNKLLNAHGLPDNFINQFQSAKGIINHPIFEDTWFKKEGLKTIQNSLMSDKPNNNELVKSYLNWIYLGMEGTGHALNLVTNTVINSVNEHSFQSPIKAMAEPLRQANKALLSQNELHQYFVSHGVSNFFNENPDYYNTVVDALMNNVEENPEKSKPLNDAIVSLSQDYKQGFKDIQNASKKVSKSLIWYANDINAYSTILKDAAEQGLDVKNIDFQNPKHTAILDKAIKNSAKNYVSYNISSEELVGGAAGRAISNTLRMKGLFIFTNYAVGNIKMLAGQVKQLREGLPEAGKAIANKEYDANKTRLLNNVVDRTVVAGLLLYGIKKVEEEINKERKPGDNIFELNRPGALKYPYDISRFAKGEVNQSDMFQKILHPMPFLMRFPNYLRNRDEFGNTLDPNSHLFGGQRVDYLFNGASMPNVEQRSVGADILHNQIEPRIGFGWSIKTDPQEHGFVTRIKDYNDFMKPEMDAMMRQIKTYRELLSEGKPSEHPIDEKGFSDFLAKANYTSGNLLNNYVDYLQRRINELNDPNNTETAPDVKDLWLKDYSGKLKEATQLQNADIRAWNEYVKKNKTTLSLTEEGKALENIGQKLSKIQSQK